LHMKKRSSSSGMFVSAVFLLIFILSGYTPDGVQAETTLYRGTPARYIFLFIGDGLGIPQRAAAEKYMNKKLVMDTFPAYGVTTTSAADRFITGSAAAATALSGATKTNIGMLGMAPDMRHVKTIAELAKDRGMRIGIVSSVSIDHATPAAFYAHVPSRNQYYDIATALAVSNFDFFGGGGLIDPLNKIGNSKHFRGNALEIIQKNGYQIVTRKSDFMSLKPGSGKVFTWNSRLVFGQTLPYALDITPEDISLTMFTEKAIELLDNPKGFFIMVEGGKIDWACHANDAATAIKDTIAFDNAVSKAAEFAASHTDETLIVVTGDHECGGLTLGFAGTRYATHFEILSHQNISFRKFSDEILKEYKTKCKGNCSFDEIKPVITRYFGLKFEGNPLEDQMILLDYQLDMLKDAYLLSMRGEEVNSIDPTAALLYGDYEPLTVTITHLLNNKSGLGWTSYQHTGVPVSTSAMGVGADIFNGYYDNTDVALKIMSVMGIPPKIHIAHHPDVK